MATTRRSTLATKSRRQAPARGVRGFGLFALVMIASSMMFALPAFIILVMASIPPMVAYYIDRDSEKYAAVAVGSLSFAAALPYVLDLWFGTFTVRQVILTLSDPYTWLVVYGAAAAGWVLYFLLPTAAHSYLKLVTEHQLSSLRKECRALAKEWGSAIEPDHAEGIAEADKAGPGI
ncbi:MAG: hypothetical protein ACTSX7_10060 [Alphaproteobacteria bacterium]